MENSKRKLETWLFENAQKLDLKVVNYTWPRFFDLNYYDISVSMVYNKKKFIGRGTAFNERDALLKASVECIERIFCSYNKTSSNGVAAFFNKKSAMINATNELLERDSFFCSFLMNARKKPVATSLFRNLRNTLNSQFNIKIQYFDISAYDSHTTILAYAEGDQFVNPFGFCIGLGTNTNIDDAIESASFEVTRNIISQIFDKKTKNIYQKPSRKILTAYKIKTPNTPDGHMKYINDISNLHSYDNWFKNKKNSSLKPIIRTLVPPIKFNKLTPPDGFIKCPLYVYKANTGKLFQNAYWGKTTNEKVNLKRIQEYAGYNIQFDDLNLNIHPLG